MSTKRVLLLGGTFYFFFLLLTPLGLFNDWIPPTSQTGYYSVTTIDHGDDAGYYAYLRSFFIDGDFDFINERKYAHAEKFNDTGYVFNNWQIGQALLFFPFFLIGHLLGIVYNALGYNFILLGYSAPYYIATAVASQTWLLVGLVFLYQIGRKFFSERVALVSALSVWLASPLLYYTFIRQRIAHTTEFCFSALFVLVWLHYRESRNLKDHFLMGACLGFLCLIRLINVCYVVLYVGDLLWQWFSKWRESPLGESRAVLFSMTAFFSMMFLVLLPQFYTWNQMNGFPISTYLVDVFKDQAQSVSWTQKLGNLYDLFLSPRWSLLFTTPVCLAGLVGLFIKGPVPLKIRFVLLGGFAALLFIVLSFIESDAYGNRYLIPVTVLFAVGLGVLLDRFSQSRLAWAGAMTFISLCVLAQYLMIVQYKVTLPYNHAQFTLEALGAVPGLILDRPGLLLRSTNFFKLMFFDNPGSWDFKDVLFLVIFPLSQLSILILVLWMNQNFEKLFQSDGLFSRPEFWLGGIIPTSLAVLLMVGIAAPDFSQKNLKIRMNYDELTRQGNDLMKKGKVVEALDVFDEASKLYSYLWNPDFKKAVAWAAMGDIPRASRSYAEGLYYHPDHGPALMNYGITLKALGKHEEAEKNLKSAIRLAPGNAKSYDALAQVYADQGKLDKAEEMFRFALEVNPQYGPGHANLAVLYTMLNKADQAKRHLILARKLGLKGGVVDRLEALYRLDPVKPSP